MIKINLKPKYVIYGLTDPETDELRYIGITKRGLKRFQEHLRSCELEDNTYKNNWIKSILNQGLKPGFSILGYANSLEEANEREQKEIAKWRAAGANLTNSTDGGDGTKGTPIKKEQKMILSEIHGGHKVIDSNGIIHETQSEAGVYYGIHRASISANLLGRTKSAHGINFRYILDDDLTPPIKIDPEEIRANAIQKRKIYRGWDGIIDDLGNIYPDLESAAKSVDETHVSRIWECLNGVVNVYKGRVFRYIPKGEKPTIPDHFDPIKAEQNRRLKLRKSHNPKSFKDQFGNVYESLNDAANKLGISKRSIHLQLLGERINKKIAHLKLTYIE